MTRQLLDPNFYTAYQRYAKYYNFYFGKLMNPGRVRAVNAAELKAGDKVLEVGVGTGLSLPFYPESVEITGIDLSEAMLERARILVKEENLKHVKALEVMDAENMTFADNAFDVVVAMHVSTVVGNPKRFAAEMRRVCKPGGKIIIVNYFHDPRTLVGKASKLIAPYAKFIGFRPDLTLQEFLEKTGLKIESMVPVNVLNMHNVMTVRNEKSGAS